MVPRYLNSLEKRLTSVDFFFTLSCALFLYYYVFNMRLEYNNNQSCRNLIQKSIGFCCTNWHPSFCYSTQLFEIVRKVKFTFRILFCTVLFTVFLLSQNTPVKYISSQMCWKVYKNCFKGSYWHPCIFKSGSALDSSYFILYNYVIWYLNIK